MRAGRMWESDFKMVVRSGGGGVARMGGGRRRNMRRRRGGRIVGRGRGRGRGMYRDIGGMNEMDDASKRWRRRWTNRGSGVWDGVEKYGDQRGERIKRK